MSKSNKKAPLIQSLRNNPVEFIRSKPISSSWFIYIRFVNNFDTNIINSIVTRLQKNVSIIAYLPYLSVHYHTW